jgi:hypothetical protein
VVKRNGLLRVYVQHLVTKGNAKEVNHMWSKGDLFILVDAA